MNFVRHPQHTRFMGAPENWDEVRNGPCGALSIQDKTHGSYTAMESCWVPEVAEGLLLAAGLADIRLGIVSRVHPPVYMGVVLKAGVEQAAVKQHIADTMLALGKLARLHGLSLGMTYHATVDSHNVAVVDLNT